jgi:ribosomal protein L37AE/L43A
MIDNPGNPQVECIKCADRCVYNERMKSYHCVKCGSMVSKAAVHELIHSPKLSKFFAVVETKSDADGVSN